MAEQPMPTPNGHPSIQSLVRADLEQREQLGVKRYGTPLQPHNGRDALLDAYEEALDLACYLRQALAEREAHQQPDPARLIADLEAEVKWQRKTYGDGSNRAATGRLIGTMDALTIVRQWVAAGPGSGSRAPRSEPR